MTETPPQTNVVITLLRYEQEKSGKVLYEFDFSGLFPTSDNVASYVKSFAPATNAPTRVDAQSTTSGQKVQMTIEASSAVENTEYLVKVEATSVTGKVDHLRMILYIRPA